MLSFVLLLLFPAVFLAASIIYVGSVRAPRKSEGKTKKKTQPKTGTKKKNLVRANKSAEIEAADNKTRSAAYKELCVIFAVEASILLLLGSVIKAFMFGGGTIPLSAVFVSSAIPFAAYCTAYSVKKGRKSRIYRFLKRASVFAAVLMVLEVIVFNAKSITRETVDTVFKKESFRSDGVYTETDNDITFTGDGNIYVDNLPDGAKAVIVKMRQEENYELYHESRPFGCELYMQDDNFTQNYMITQSKYVTSFDGECDFSLNPYGKLRSIRLHLYWLSEPVTIEEVRVVSAIPYSFSITRFFVLLAVLSAISAIRISGLHKVTFSTRNRAHLIAANAMAVMCALTAVFFYKPDMKSEEYSEIFPPLGNPYAMQAQAFEEGQLALPYTPDPNMEQVENIYSPDQRTSSGVSYLWDYAYKDGKYYCYFGVTPTITLFYPYQHIKHKIMPIPKAVFIFSILAMFFFCQTIIAAVKLLSPRCNLLLLLLSMPAAVGCAGFYYILNYADMYCVPLASGMMFLSLCLWLGLTAYMTKNKTKRLILLACSGISLAFAVGARPGMALCCIILVPFFLALLLRKKDKLMFRLSEAACFLTPVMIGAVAIMWYNNARFGSPFDFGASYQLTVSDIHANKVNLAGLPAAIYHYFFMSLRPRAVFPFFEQQATGLNNYGQYVYIDFAIPVFTLPIIALGFLLLPMCFRKKNTCCCRETTVLQRNAYYILAICMALFIAWEDFCLGGLIQRYIIDTLPCI